jgi:hypothetical protein
METPAMLHKIEFYDNVLNFHNKTFYYIESLSTLIIEPLDKYDAIILDARNVEFTRIIIKLFRSSPHVDYYLKPIFLINAREATDPYISELSDGSLSSFDQIPEIINDINDINQRAAQLEHAKSKSFEVQLFNKVLNYLFTRNINNLKPHHDINSAIGYSYPVISVNFEPFEESKVLDHLEWAEKENLIWPDFHDRIYLCNNCKCGHLSYREICPNCDSANMRAEDLVHHFPCGYIGALSDFRNQVDTVLSCPKCSKELRHIGVDYDKPSIINHCQNCNEVFQDYLVKAKCVQCGNDSDVQFLISKNIHVYKLTKKGRTAALSGMFTSDFVPADEVSGSIDPKVFNTMMHYERERLKSNAVITSNIVVLYFENIFDLYRIIGRSKEKPLLSEIVLVIRANITPADFISVNNPSLITVCMNDTSPEQVKLSVDRIIRTITELIANNFNKFSLKISSTVQPLTKEKPFDKQLQTIIRELVERA